MSQTTTAFGDAFTSAATGGTSASGGISVRAAKIAKRRVMTIVNPRDTASTTPNAQRIGMRPAGAMRTQTFAYPATRSRMRCISTSAETGTAHGAS
ncbi:hypothetical protein GCM10022267_88940 [Lentzea roselyniae]|uniref:Uncharacterized protein n=1 Tax=Lentzea roselyniae TaxID=531940 RepID=A0ABP7CGN8_9PSEU